MKIRNSLQAEIYNTIVILDDMCIIKPLDRNIMAEALESFVILSTTKYIKGQLEHGGNLIEHIDLTKCMKEEVMDLFWYLSYKEKQEEQKQ